MDFFLKYPNLYFTPNTVALSMKLSINSVKACMNLLRKNSYLSKLENSTVYHIKKDNMEFWVTDFRRHVLGSDDD